VRVPLEPREGKALDPGEAAEDGSRHRGEGEQGEGRSRRSREPPGPAARRKDEQGDQRLARAEHEDEKQGPEGRAGTLLRGVIVRSVSPRVQVNDLSVLVGDEPGLPADRLAESPGAIGDPEGDEAPGGEVAASLFDESEVSDPVAEQQPEPTEQERSPDVAGATGERHDQRSGPAPAASPREDDEGNGVVRPEGRVGDGHEGRCHEEVSLEAAHGAPILRGGGPFGQVPCPFRAKGGPFCPFRGSRPRMGSAMGRPGFARAFAAAILVAVGAAGIPGPRAEKAAAVRQEVTRLLNEGAAALARHDYTEAIEKLRRCASVYLNSFHAYYYLGSALMGARRYEEAIEALQVALDLDPSHPGANVAIGNAWLRRGDVEEAFAAFYRALELRGDDSSALDGIARTYQARAEDEKAIETYRKILERDKGYAEAYTHLGDLLLEKGRVSEAVSLLSEAVKIRPDFAEGLDRLAAAYARVGFFSEAIASIERAIALEPGSAAHLATLGAIRLEMGLLGAAETSFSRALELDPGLPEAREGMAEIARRRGDYGAARAAVAMALADPRTDSASRRRLEKLEEALVREEEEVRRLEPRLATGDASAEELRALAAIYARRGDFARAAELEARSDPAGRRRETLAYYLLRAGRFREAHALYAALAQEARRSDLYVNAGVSLARLGDARAAAEAFRRALDLDPKDLRAKVYLANAYLRLGRTAEAVELYKAYLSEGPAGETAERVRRVLLQVAPEALRDVPPPAPPLATLPGAGER